MSLAAALPDVIRDFERVDADVVAQAAGFASSILADVAGRRGALHGLRGDDRPPIRNTRPSAAKQMRWKMQNGHGWIPSWNCT